MKLIVFLSLVCLTLVSEEVMSDLVRGENTAYRWPSATVSCPPGKIMVSGGGSCKSLDNRGWTFLYESRPFSENSYIVRCDTPENQNVMAEAYVVCVDRETSE